MLERKYSKILIYFFLSIVVGLRAQLGPPPWQYDESQFIYLSSGVKYIILEQGKGPLPKLGEILKIHYIGMLSNGKVFDNSFERGTPLQFKLGAAEVIPGWEEVFKYLPIGSKAVIHVPPEFGYGDEGVPPTIPPKSTLIFFIEVLSKQMPFQPYTHDTKKRIKKESGLEYAIIEQGNGTAITPSSKVSLHYNARLSNGVILGNTFDKGEPLVVIMGKNQLFKGWEEGLSYLKQGDKATLIIPPHLGPDVGTNIPKEESIIIDLEILSVEPYEQFKPYKYEHLPFQESPNGVPFYLVEKGNGPLPKIGEFVKMHYHGVIRNKNGERFFDSTFERGKPATLLLGNSEALRAWDEILPLVPKGSKIVMTLTPEKISQEKNLPPIIGTDSILIFYIYLLE